MSKLVAFIFGAFLVVVCLVFALLFIVHISRVLFARDRFMSIREIFSLLLWWLAVLNDEGRERIYHIVFKRDKRK